MSDIKHARRLLDMAWKEVKALGGMLDSEFFCEEIFGFHTQQAVEKALKAWLALLGIEYPKTHDLTLLLYLLERQKIKVKDFWDFITFNAHAVQFMYEAYDFTDESYDRPQTLSQVDLLINKVDQLVKHIEPPR